MSLEWKASQVFKNKAQLFGCYELWINNYLYESNKKIKGYLKWAKKGEGGGGGFCKLIVCESWGLCKLKPESGRNVWQQGQKWSGSNDDGFYGGKQTKTLGKLARLGRGTPLPPPPTY